MVTADIAARFMEQLSGQLDTLTDEIDVCMNKSDNDPELLLCYNRLVRYSNDVDTIRKREYFGGKLGGVLSERVDKLDRKLQMLIMRVELMIEHLHTEKVRQDKAQELEEIAKRNANGGISFPQEDVQLIDEKHAAGDYAGGESLDSLKARLLATRHSQLDEVRTTESQNNYHDSLQQELIDSLPSMVSSLKEQAIQFQEILKQDAVVLKEATQTFETSHGKFDTVNALLSKYHKEGRLGFWFYIRTIGMVMVAFVFLLVIIRLIPARH